MNPRADVDRLLDEIALLRDVMEAYQRQGHSVDCPEYEEQLKVESEWFFYQATRAGISEDDADHPCRAIDRREARLREIAPDRVLREMGAAMLPGLEA